MSEPIQKKEAVNSPSHYLADSGVETIVAIEAWGMGEGFCAGNVIKYVSRYRHKEKPLEDLRKAQWYLARLIEGVIRNG